MSEFSELRNIKTPSMHHGLGSVTLSQLAFQGESTPNFPWEKSHWDNTVVESIKKKKELITTSIVFVHPPSPDQTPLLQNMALIIQQLTLLAPFICLGWSTNSFTIFPYLRIPLANRELLSALGNRKQERKKCKSNADLFMSTWRWFLNLFIEVHLLCLTCKFHSFASSWK